MRFVTLRGLLASLLLLSACSLVNAPSESNLDGGVRDADAPDVPIVVEEDCETEGDEDGNGQADCEDWVCSGSLQCCDDNNISPVNLAANSWTPYGLTRDGADYSGTGLVQSPECTAMFTGGSYRLDFSFAECDGECSIGFAGSFVRAISSDDANLRQDFSVDVEWNGDGSARVVLSRVERVVEMLTLSGLDPASETYELSVRVTPGAVDGSLGLWVGVDLEARNTTSNMIRTLGTLEATPIVQNEQLIRECGREDLPGLFPGVRMNADAGEVRVISLLEKPLGCPNPSIFENTLLPFAAESMGAVTNGLGLVDYAGGSITQPGLLWHGGDIYLTLAASELDPSLEGTDPAFRWDLLLLTGDGSTFSEISTAPYEEGTEPDVRVVGSNQLVFRTPAGLMVGDLQLSGAEQGCRHPAFGANVNVNNNQFIAREYFYVCDAMLTQRWVSVDPAVDKSAIGPTFSGTVLDLDVVVTVNAAAGTESIRLWVLLEQNGEASLHLYQGTTTLMDGDNFEPTTEWEAFPGNPVVEEAELLTGDLRGFSVVRRESPEELYFLFSYVASGEWRLLPVTQPLNDE